MALSDPCWNTSCRQPNLAIQKARLGNTSCALASLSLLCVLGFHHLSLTLFLCLCAFIPHSAAPPPGFSAFASHSFPVLPSTHSGPVVASGNCSDGCLLEQDVSSPRRLGRENFAVREVRSADFGRCGPHAVLDSQERRSGTSGGRRSKRKFRRRCSLRPVIAVAAAFAACDCSALRSGSLGTDAARQVLRTPSAASRWELTVTW